MNKGLEYIKSKIPFSDGFHEGDMEDVVIKGIDIAIKEVIDNRDRIHTINLECARQGTAKAIFDDIEKMSQFYVCKDKKCKECQTYYKVKAKHRNTKNTDKTLKELKEFREKNWDKTLSRNKAYEKYINTGNPKEAKK